MGSDAVPDWGQACNSTVYRIVWRSVKHFFRFSANFLRFFCEKIFNFFTILPWKTLSPQDIVARFYSGHNGPAGAFLMYYKLHYRNMDAQPFLWYTNLVSAALLKTLTEWMFYGFFQGRFRGRAGVLQNADGRADL